MVAQNSRVSGSAVALPVEFVAVDPAVMICVVETGGRIFVEDHRGAGVKLESGTGTNCGERTFDHVFDGADFRGTEREEQAAARIKDGADAHRECVFRHGVEGAEDRAVITERLLGEDLNPRARAERAGGLIEADVTVAAEAEELDVDAARVEDALFVAAALGVKIGRRANGHVGALLVDVDVAEEIFPHEIPVGLVVGAGEADILVEVERRDPAEVEALVAMQADELLVKTERSATGGEAEDGFGFFADDPGDNFRAEEAADFGIVADEDFHGDERI